MAEILRPVEIGKEAGLLALAGLFFVVDRLKGGAWADLPHPEQGPVQRPQRAPKPVMANITYLNIPERAPEPPDIAA